MPKQWGKAHYRSNYVLQHYFRKLTKLLLAQLLLEQTQPAPDRQAAAIRHSQYQKWLLEHREEYAGQWVALDGDRLVSSGKNNREALAEARRQGVRVPFVVYIEPTDALPFKRVENRLEQRSGRRSSAKV